MSELATEFVKATQQAAVAAYPWVGKQRKNPADAAATEALRNHLNLIDFTGEIKIGEGEMDEAPMLFIGEKVGTGSGPEIDIAVDPIDGTALVAAGKGNAITVIAAADSGSLLHAPDMYMEKIAVGPKAKGKISLEVPIGDNLKAVAAANGKKITELRVAVQKRPRHAELMMAVQRTGAEVVLFSDVDITLAVATCLDEIDIDMVAGVGGAPEGVIGAVALRILGGDFQGKLLPKNEIQRQRCLDMGISEPDRMLLLEDLVASDNCFFAATGITDGILLRGLIPGDEHKVRVQSFLYNECTRKALSIC
ncbi:class II fructose-bisphosphatase [Virgibacillus halophilus]|uniref:Fructose-1,6-bisphosphatase n=1 Tax=Tigheibacillus halophilus TaxID=361280 RepID=A0ABU5C208_9BACI|nr:class II fructose-bisphosphatase [Virgibacillus halophilus]